MCTVNEDHRYTVPETKGATDRIFCLFTPPPPSPDNPENQNLKN